MKIAIFFNNERYFFVLLLEGSVESRECMPALHQKVAEQKQIIATLEDDIENLSNKFEVRESSLIQRIAMLTRKLQMQSMQFQNHLRNCQTRLDQILAVKNNNNSCDSKVIYLNKVIYINFSQLIFIIFNRKLHI